MHTRAHHMHMYKIHKIHIPVHKLACTCLFMHTHVHTYTCVHAHTKHMYTHGHLYTYTETHMCTCTCISTQTPHTCTHLHKTLVYMCTHISISTHMHISINRHMYTQTCTDILAPYMHSHWWGVACGVCNADCQPRLPWRASALLGVGPFHSQRTGQHRRAFGGQDLPPAASCR